MGEFTAQEMADECDLDVSSVNTVLNRDRNLFVEVGQRQGKSTGRPPKIRRLAPDHSERILREIESLWPSVAKLTDAVTLDGTNPFGSLEALHEIQERLDRLYSVSPDGRTLLLEQVRDLIDIELTTLSDHDEVGLAVPEGYRRQLEKLEHDLIWEEEDLSTRIDDLIGLDVEGVRNWFVNGLVNICGNVQNPFPPFSEFVYNGNFSKLNRIIRILYDKNPEFADIFRIAAIAAIGSVEKTAVATGVRQKFYRFCVELRSDKLADALNRHFPPASISTQEIGLVGQILIGLNIVDHHLRDGSIKAWVLELWDEQRSGCLPPVLVAFILPVRKNFGMPALPRHESEITPVRSFLDSYQDNAEKLLTENRWLTKATAERGSRLMKGVWQFFLGTAADGIRSAGEGKFLTPYAS